ncbi:hypothetical protein MMC32_006806 [Xylographa parallela]|nr:hypothetical protein [Xylographa parallela]
MSVLFYKRPDHIEKLDGPLDSSSCQKYSERAACSRAAIPESLSFDNVINGKTLPPMSLPDFMDYLVYISYDAENLQFYLWHQEYTKKFNALPEAVKCLSPKWEANMQAPSLGRVAAGRIPQREAFSLDTKELGTFYNDATDDSPTSATSFAHSPHTFTKDQELVISGMSSKDEPDWEAFSIQPLRDDIRRIVANYIEPGSDRELNLSHRDRHNIMQRLQHTTHPSAFAPIVEIISMTLRNQSHPNFIRWSMCNGNRPRVIALRGIAICVILVTTTVGVILAVSRAARWYRILCLPFLWFGIANIVASYKGLCILLYRRNTRESRPWELDGSDTTLLEQGRAHSSLPPTPPYTRTPTPSVPSVKTYDRDFSSSSFFDDRLSTLGPSNKNFREEQWYRRWTHRPWWRKLRIKKLKVQEEGLRLMQEKIVKQADWWATIVAIPLIIVLVALPEGNFF